MDNHESPRYGRGRLHNSRSDLRLVTEERLLLFSKSVSAVAADNNGELTTVRPSSVAEHQQKKRRTTTTATITVSCISRVGSQEGVAIERRSEWVVSYAHHHGHRHQQQLSAVTTTVFKEEQEEERSNSSSSSAGDDDAQNQGPIALSSGASHFLIISLCVLEFVQGCRCATPRINLN